MVKRGKNVRSGRHIEPMLCTLVKEPPENDEYLFEVKWDGYRILSFVENGQVYMNSRSGLNYTERYPTIEKALKNLKHDVIIDGEVVVFNQEGQHDFDALQLYNGKTSPIRYCVFDLLAVDGKDIKQLPLVQRKELLKALVGGDDTFLFSENFDNGKELFEHAIRDNLEGIVAKARHSEYSPGARGNDWLKIPTRKRQEFVIGGWAESDTSRSFKSLLFGAYENGKLNWIGRSGGGYKNHEMPGILKRLKELETNQSPFANKILDTKGARIHYVKPDLVANFEFATWTKSGRIRKPATFLGFREDKDPKDVVREVPKDTEAVEQELEQDIQEEETEDRSELEKYNEKRHFNETPEPKGGKPAKDQLIFVVQKHAASHLHYDFRLEMRGVLKSWAVPKGPSMQPEENRLAMAVEDHPYDYKDFEGIIPKGQYGGGTVIVWDQGTYEPAEKIKGKKEQEHWLLSHYYKNSLSIRLHGSKLKGEFQLVREKGERENAWYLTKVKDSHALKSDISKKDKSVVSGLTLEEVAASSNPDVWQSNRGQGKDENEQSGKEAQTVGDLYPDKKKVSGYSNWKAIFEEPVRSQGAIEVEGESIRLTNIEKKLWKDTTKADLLAYYNQVSDLILPYLKDRPLSLHIKQANANAPGLYIKDMEGNQPPYVDIFSDKRRIPKPGKRSRIDYAICNNKAALLYFVNLGCIDFNPWSARSDSPSELDYISIDLDPTDDDFQKVISTAQAVKEVLDANGLEAVVKTSGKTGLHIYIPCSGFSNAVGKQLGKIVYEQVNQLVPDITTDTVAKDKRGSKVYVDYTLNDYADTLASVYSVRPYPIPGVSTPLEWKEVKAGLDPSDYTVKTVLKRFEKKGDLFRDLFDAKVIKGNTKVLQKLLE